MGNMEPRINVITLGVQDLKTSTAFYRDGLGWTTLEEEGITFVKLNNIVLGLYPQNKLMEDAQQTEPNSGAPTFTLAYNTANEKEVDEIIDSAIAAGAKHVKKPQKVFWGGYSGYFADPDGHLWEVAHNPFWKLDNQGLVQL